jgi:hypothetical protein
VWCFRAKKKIAASRIIVTPEEQTRTSVIEFDLAGCFGCDGDVPAAGAEGSRAGTEADCGEGNCGSCGEVSTWSGRVLGGTVVGGIAAAGTSPPGMFPDGTELGVTSADGIRVAGIWLVSAGAGFGGLERGT